MSDRPQRDLVVLVADKDMEYALRGILSRSASLQIRGLTTDIYPHPAHDPGCLRHSDNFLRSFAKRYAHAMVLFDREGCGQESLSREEIEEDVEDRLSRSGWGDRAAAVVIDPELETWVWSDSPNVDRTLGWAGRTPNLRSWLVSHGVSFNAAGKPDGPKTAMQTALRAAQKAKSPNRFLELAQTVSFDRCADPAFHKLLERLRAWFAA